MTNQIKFSNYSKLSRGKGDAATWYEWCVFVDEPKEVLAEISKVKYLLHPTFSPPIRIIDTRENKFALFSNGWGEFNISIEVYFTDNSLQTTSHHLRLEENDWPVIPVEDSNLTEDEKQVVNLIGESDFSWRQFSTIKKRTSLNQSELDETLNSLIEKNIVRKGYYQSINKENLYGLTEKVGMEPRAE